MSLKNMTLQSGVFSGSSITVGTPVDQVFVDNGVSVQNGVQLVVPASAANVREQVTAKFRPALLNPDGEYSKNKNSISYAVPRVTAAGNVVYNVIRIEREVHPEFMADAPDELNLIGAQLLMDSDTTNFWAVGSMS